MADQTEKYPDTVGEAIEAHRKFARDAIEQAADRAADRIKRGVYSDREASDLMIHIENARTALDVLGQHLDGLTSVSPEAGLQAWYYVGPLMEAMYAVGGLLEISDSADRHAVTYETTVRRIRQMHAGASKAADERNRMVDDAILACVAGDRSKLLSTREKLTPSHAEVVAKLPEGAQATWRKVRDRIITLKAEWRESEKESRAGS